MTNFMKYPVLTLCLAVPVLGLAACAAIPTIQEYHPIGVGAASSGGTLRVAVALVENQSPSPTESEEDVRLADVRMQHKRLMRGGPKTHAVHNHSNNKNSPVGPEALTAMLIKELKASGKFASVDHEGAGTADILVKPTLKWCTLTILGLNLHNVWDFEIEIEVLKGGKSVMKKSYKKRWEKWNMQWTDAYANKFPPLMQEIRNDIVRSTGG